MATNKLKPKASDADWTHTKRERNQLNSVANITDCHMHLIGPQQKFPFSQGNQDKFAQWSATEYLQLAKPLGIERYVVTQTPFYGTDNSNLLYSLQQLGGSARGIAVVDSSIGEAQYQQLNAAGVVGANFYLMPGGELDWSCLAPTNERIQDLCWQTQLQFNGRELEQRLAQISSLQGTLVIDHVGKFQPSVSTADASFKALCKLLDSGRCYVKLSAPYESSDNQMPYLQQAGSLARFLIREYPDFLVWGSNWPHLGLNQRAHWPDTSAAMNCISDWGGDEQTQQKIFTTTPGQLFGFDRHLLKQPLNQSANPHREHCNDQPPSTS